MLLGFCHYQYMWLHHACIHTHVRIKDSYANVFCMSAVSPCHTLPARERKKKGEGGREGEGGRGRERERERESCRRLERSCALFPLALYSLSIVQPRTMLL